jgi:hypothetical protein
VDGEGEEGVNIGAEGLSFIFNVGRLRSGADDEVVVVVVVVLVLLFISGVVLGAGEIV